MRTVLQQIDDLELELDKLGSIRDIVKSFRPRVEDLDRSLRDSPPTSHPKSRFQRQQLETNTRQVSQAHSDDSRAHEMAALNLKDKPTLLPEGPLIETELSYDLSLPSSSRFVAGWLTEIFKFGVGQDLTGSLSITNNQDTNNFGTSQTSGASTAWSTNTDDADDTGSGDSEDWCSPIEWQHHLILEAVMAEFYNLLHQGLKSATASGAYNQSGSTSSTQSSPSTNRSVSSANQSSISSTSNALGPKRLNQDGEFPPPNEDQDSNKRPRTSGATSRDDNSTRRYACPFFKHDPRKYGQRGSCTGPGFNSIAHLKYVKHHVSQRIY
jgi:hypothetical protein